MDDEWISFAQMESIFHIGRRRYEVRNEKGNYRWKTMEKILCRVYEKNLFFQKNIRYRRCITSIVCKQGFFPWNMKNGPDFFKYYKNKYSEMESLKFFIHSRLTYSTVRKNNTRIFFNITAHFRRVTNNRWDNNRDFLGKNHQKKSTVRLYTCKDISFIFSQSKISQKILLGKQTKNDRGFARRRRTWVYFEVHVYRASKIPFSRFGWLRRRENDTDDTGSYLKRGIDKFQMFKFIQRSWIKFWLGKSPEVEFNDDRFRRVCSC